MPEGKIPSERVRLAWMLVLLIPFIALCFPQMYARQQPELWGFPFFYWYQFVWVILTSTLMGLVYKKLRY